MSTCLDGSTKRRETIPVFSSKDKSRMFPRNKPSLSITFFPVILLNNGLSSTCLLILYKAIIPIIHMPQIIAREIKSAYCSPKALICIVIVLLSLINARRVL